MNPFIHLHVHSQYSLLDGQASVKALVDKAIANGMKGLALTDHGNMFGAKEFFNYVNKKNGAVKKEIQEAEEALAKAREEGDEAAAAEAEAKRKLPRIKFSSRFLAARCMWPTKTFTNRPTNAIPADTLWCSPKMKKDTIIL